MVPPTIRSNLAGLRRRERLLTFVWGAACWLCVVIVLVLLGGAVDWLIDRERDTPEEVHVGILAVQAIIAAVAGLWFLVWPQICRLPDDKLALWVEDKLPHFEHRLISAIQLNRPGANLAGMSPELVKVVTREAEGQAKKVGFAQVADHRRLKWSLGVLTPVVLLAGLPFALWPELSFALLQRQALFDVEIPRSVYLESASAAVWPIGDTIPIRFRVTGQFSDKMIGRLSVTAAGQGADRYPLHFIMQDEKGALFGADVPAYSADINYAARLADGRTRYPSEMKLVPRPVVTGNEAWTPVCWFIAAHGPTAAAGEKKPRDAAMSKASSASMSASFCIRRSRSSRRWARNLGPEAQRAES